MISLRKMLLTAATAALALTLSPAASAGVGTPPAPAAPAITSSVAPTQLYAKHVKSNVQSIRVFRTPTGEETWGVWGPCTNFWTDRTDGSRYHTWAVINGIAIDVWVTADPTWVADGHC